LTAVRVPDLRHLSYYY